MLSSDVACHADRAVGMKLACNFSVRVKNTFIDDWDDGSSAEADAGRPAFSTCPELTAFYSLFYEPELELSPAVPLPAPPADVARADKDIGLPDPLTASPTTACSSPEPAPERSPVPVEWAAEAFAGPMVGDDEVSEEGGASPQEAFRELLEWEPVAPAEPEPAAAEPVGEEGTAQSRGHGAAGGVHGHTMALHGGPEARDSHRWPVEDAPEPARPQGRRRGGRRAPAESRAEEEPACPGAPSMAEEVEGRPREQLRPHRTQEAPAPNGAGTAGRAPAKPRRSKAAKGPKEAAASPGAGAARYTAEWPACSKAAKDPKEAAASPGAGAAHYAAEWPACSKATKDRKDAAAISGGGVARYTAEWPAGSKAVKDPKATTQRGADVARCTAERPAWPKAVKDPKATTQRGADAARCTAEWPAWPKAWRESKGASARAGAASACSAPRPPQSCEESPAQTTHVGRSGRGRKMWCHLYLSEEMLMHGFDLSKKVIGHGGCGTKGIYEATGAKIRLRGRGSGHIEGNTGREAPAHLMLSVTVDNCQAESFRAAVRMAAEHLAGIEDRFHAFCRHWRARAPEGRCFWVGEIEAASKECLGAALNGLHIVLDAKRAEGRKEDS